MTRMIVVLMTLLFAGMASAQTQQTKLDLTGLTPDQVQALNTAIEQLRKQPENTLANLSLQTITPDRFTEWANAGEAAGKAVANFTREIGVGADAFLKTDVGRIGFFVLLWKFGGDQVAASVLNMALGLIMAVTLYTFWWKMTRRFVLNERREFTADYHQNTFLRWLGFNKKSVSWVKDQEWLAQWDANDRFWMIFWARTLCIALFVMITFMVWPKVVF